MEEYIEQHNTAPCLDYEEEDLEKSDILPELGCWMFLDEDFQTDQLGAGNPNVEGGELIYLFDYIEEEIQNIIAKK